MVDRERIATRDLATISEHFKEIEVQFKNNEKLREQQISEILRRLDKQELDGNPRHDERIKVLERLLHQLNDKRSTK